MGADNSKYGAIKVVLEKYIFNPGEPIRGTINVLLNEEIPPCSLNLHFKGAEVVRWVEHRGKHTYHFFNKFLISKTKYTLMSWNVPLPAGSFVVPFVFQLPQGLPGSFNYIAPGVLLSLVYKVYARLRTNDAKLRDKVPVGIMNEVPLQRPIEGGITANLISWCCNKKGSVDIAVRWINDKYSPGLPIQCILDVDNSKSLAKVKGVTATAYCIIFATASGGYRRPFKLVLFRSTYIVHVAPGGKIIGDQGQPFAFDLANSTNRSIDLTNVHTMNGNIIDCTFYIDFELELNISCLCCGDQPLLTSIFFVKPVGSFVQPAVAAPQNWNPQMFNPVQVVYDPKNEADDKGESQLLQQYKSGNPNLDNTKI
jgi:hypothetical protein